MKTIILCGGMGTRLAEETVIKPKPLVEVGGKSILWHIMSFYAAQGHRDFILALGYKGDMIKESFLNFYALNNDLSIDLRRGFTNIHDGRQPDWRIDLVDTGLQTQTGGRIKRLQSWIGGGTFMATYGDGLADVNIKDLLDFHKSHGRLATLTAVRPPARFGGLRIEGSQVVEFLEKPVTGEGWINGGYFVLEPGIFDYIEGDSTLWEHEPLERLAMDGQLMAFEHPGFFQPMDTLREKNLLENLWQSGKAPWKIWE
jgi:glucose-1-phosphate cytidylyltransferase